MNFKNKNLPLIGAHVSFLKESQLEGSIKDLLKIGATSGGFYISDSRAWRKSYELSFEKILKAKQIASNNNFDLEKIIVHSPLIGNIANTELDQKIHNLTVESYIKDVKRLHQCGIILYNFHPGSAKDSKLGIKTCAKGINKIIQETNETNVILCIETMMKKGNYIGKNFQEIKEIINLVKNKNRVGVTIDTCHIWDFGYDLNDIDKVLKEFDNVIGLNYLKGLHINDSKNELGSNKDRHENIGKGFIGLDNLKKIVNHPLLKNLPKVLETPYTNDNIKKWQEEIKILIN